MAEQVFDSWQVDLLNADLDPRLVSERKGGGNSTLSYIEGHHAIDQANRVFGFGNWAYKPTSIEAKVIHDPLTGEAVGVMYEATIELTVRGCIAPVVEVGTQPVTSWNVVDVAMSRRKKDDKERELEQWEIVNARRTIVDAHEMAKKGCATDGLKRCLRTFGSQFGNSLYGDGPIDFTPAGPIEEIKKRWVKAFSVKDEEIDERWNKFKVYIAGQQIDDKDVSDPIKQKMLTYINNRRAA